MLAALAGIIRDRASERVTVAVVYGAAHIPGIVHGLFEKHGFRPVAAEWVTILDADV